MEPSASTWTSASIWGSRYLAPVPRRMLLTDRGRRHKRGRVAALDLEYTGGVLVTMSDGHLLRYIGRSCNPATVEREVDALVRLASAQRAGR
jgi:hypothetical protein